MIKVIRKPVEIDEKELAKDLSDFLYEALCYQDEDIAEEVAYGDYEIQRLIVLNRIGEVWHEELLKKIADNKTTSEKGV